MLTQLQHFMSHIDTSYRAFCRDCNRFVADEWNPFSNELLAREHRDANPNHWLALYTDDTSSSWGGE